MLADILAASDASLRPGLALETPAAKCGWWHTRIALDGRLAALLTRLDASWLGPWRCVLWCSRFTFHCAALQSSKPPGGAARPPRRLLTRPLAVQSHDRPQLVALMYSVHCTRLVVQRPHAIHHCSDRPSPV